MNILVGGIYQETNTFSKIPVRYQDFQVSRGDQIRLALPECELLEEAGHTLLLAVSARTLPSGPLDQKEFGLFLEEFFAAAKKAGEWPDAIYVSLHGGMFVEGAGSGEYCFLKELRKQYGNQIPIFASFDFHGNMFPELAGLLNYATAYRTAPHVDVEETGRRAVGAMIQCLKDGRIPTVRCIQIPMAFPGERVITAQQPAKDILAKARKAEEEEQVLEISWFCGFVWSDARDICMSIAVSACEFPEGLKRRITSLAQNIWERRREFIFGTAALECREAVRLAFVEAEDKNKVFLSDSGDNVTAGASGDSVFMAKLLNEELEYKIREDGKQKKWKVLLSGVADQRAVEECFSHEVSEEFPLSFGGSLDPENTPAKGMVTLLGKGSFCDGTGGKKVRYARIGYGAIQVLLNDVRFAYTQIKHFTAVGICLEEYQVICVKLGYLYPELAQTAQGAIIAFSPGNAPLDVAMIPYNDRERKFFPRCELEFEPFFA